MIDKDIVSPSTEGRNAAVILLGRLKPATRKAMVVGLARRCGSSRLCRRTRGTGEKITLSVDIGGVK